MAKYIVYCLDQAGRFERAEWIDAANDAEALAAARAMDLPNGCEVWLKDRMVGKVDSAAE